MKTKGYAARPGTGPSGETCKTCEHAACNSMSKNYWKCALLRQVWTGGFKTDIRLKSPACSFWQRHQACVDCNAPLTEPTSHIKYDQRERRMIEPLCSKCLKKRENNGQNKGHMYARINTN